ncbi:ABC transporter substrate-binding protein [Chelatococcus reniformis]|uniref:ABC transporter substrate-binding protein n=1 Tax=Chelatococcus reniformis TaxID=1494448 RepID=A0A916U5D5_9HYPH|nr:ABC transporter substrate-binding protein [Chelatococcus reniformis]GGC61269.1 ABC transporter substrate-binding protein [Chelatococcus reniformis]
MVNLTRRGVLGTGAALLASGIARPALARSYKDPGVSDTLIRIGTTVPFSGPASAYGIIGTSDKAYFDMVNAQGGINGRKVEIIALDDAYSPPKTVEAVRRLVEQDEVFCMFNNVGTAANSAVAKYLTARKIPALFITSGASKWGNPKEYPWTVGFQPPYSAEGQIIAQHMLATIKDPKVAVLMQNDDFGKDYFNGFVAGLGGRERIAELATYEISDPTVDSQMVKLKSSGANVFFNISSPKFAAQSIRKVAEMQWKVVHYMNSTSISMPTLRAAGLENCQGMISINYMKDPTDPKWHQSPDYKAWLHWMDTYNTSVSKSENATAFCFAVSYTLHQVLLACGGEMTRENVMRQAFDIRDLAAPMLLPGVKVSTSADNHYPLRTVYLMKFEGETWSSFGEPMTAKA